MNFPKMVYIQIASTDFKKQIDEGKSLPECSQYCKS